LVGVEEVELLTESFLQALVAVEFGNHIKKRINYCVTGNGDACLGDTFVEQVLLRVGGRSEMQGAQSTSQFAITLFRPGRVDIARAQACFDMAYRDLLIVC